MLSVMMLNIIMLGVVMLSVVMLSVIMLSVVMLNVMAPFLKQFVTSKHTEANTINTLTHVTGAVS
jgi:hypothetical protein